MTQTVGPLAAAYLHDPRRRILLGGLSNFRDVGGYPIGGGGSVRWRMLLRSNAPYGLDEAGRAAVSEMGLRTVLDLRTQAEVNQKPDPPIGPNTHVPLVPTLDTGPIEVGPFCRYLVDECGDQLAAAIGTLCKDGALPALVHCNVGRDRTGVVIGLTLGVLGVPDEVIAADYALSAGYLAQDKNAASWPPGEMAKVLVSSPPERMLAILSRVRTIAGSPEGYLRSHGLANSSIEQLRSALIHRPPRGPARRSRGRARDRARPVGPAERTRPAGPVERS